MKKYHCTTHCCRLASFSSTISSTFDSRTSSTVFYQQRPSSLYLSLTTSPLNFRDNSSPA